MTGTHLGRQMAAEMLEQPDRIAMLVRRRREISDQIRPLFKVPPVGMVVVARGSSDHAATCGAYMLEMASRRPVAGASPSIQLLYGTEIDYEDYVVVAVSQSGRTPEIAAVLEAAGRSGGRTIAITNDADSPLAEVADVVVALGVGEEKAVPATKTVTAEILVFAMLASAIAPIGIGSEDFERLGDQVSAVLSDDAPIASLADWLLEAGCFSTTARGLLYGTAAECALKVEETTSLLTTAFSAADLRHGPIAIASRGVPIVAFAHPGPAAGDVLSLVADLERRGAAVRLLGPFPGAAAGWDAAAPEALATVLGVVRGQQLAHRLALNLERDPDAPQGLEKITLT